MKKITITNAYTWYNKGDAGILLGIVTALKQIYGINQIEFNILSFTPDEDRKRYCKDSSIKNVYSNVLNPHPYKHNKIGKIIAIIILIFKAIYYCIFSNLNVNFLKKKHKNIEVLADSDIIVVCGGGFLGGKKLDSFMHVFQMYINTKFGKPVYVMGTSIEPMYNKIVKKFTDNILKKMTHVYAREIITYNYLKKILPQDKFTLIPDMAFMLEDKKKKFKNITYLKKRCNKIYGLTVRKWNFPNYHNPNILMENYVNSLVEFINEEVEKNNNAFVFVPQVIVSHGNDADVANQIKEKLKDRNKNNFLVLTDDLSPIEIKSLIGNFDYFIGTRMHSNIFATSIKIPTIAIAYEKKTIGIMHTLGLDDYVIKMNNITVNVLREKVLEQKNNRKKIIKHLDEEIPEIRKEIIIKLKKNLISEEK